MPYSADDPSVGDLKVRVAEVKVSFLPNLKMISHSSWESFFIRILYSINFIARAKQLRDGKAIRMANSKNLNLKSYMDSFLREFNPL